MRHRFFSSSVPLWAAALLAAFAVPAASQDLLPKEEFRGAWIASVINLDWPSCRTCSPEQQQASLITMLDGLQASGTNAVLFQVRSEGDAMYPSEIEPWSYWLTGAQGTAPNPVWDPLQFAIKESHMRGMELHAWINPYRADRGSSYTKAASHVTNAHPEWLLEFTRTDLPSIFIFDPGLQVSRDRIASVVADIVRRYDVDGIHYDDYFYPYPPNQITNQDAASFAADPRGFTDRGAWRRDNVNLMVAQVRDSIQAIRPEVVHGISPFGIWKNGVPSGIVGLDAYNVIYGDAVAWLNAELIDYVTPQLYWKFGGGQDYGKLAPWWESVRNDRHFYPGLGLYRSDRSTFTGTLFAPEEVPNQIRLNRATDGIQGQVLFRAKNVTAFPSQGIRDTLRTDLYRQPALTPSMAWKSQDAPDTPTGLSATHTSGEGSIALAWSAPASGDADARFYAVYRIPQAEAGDLASAMADNRYLELVTGETNAVDASDESGDFTYVVTAVSANSIESAPSNTATVQNVISTDDPADALALRLEPASPNPFRGQTRVRFSLPESGTVSLRVVDVLGREVARLLDDEPRAGGVQSLTWTPNATIRSGTYFLVLDTETKRQTRSVVYVR